MERDDFSREQKERLAAAWRARRAVVCPHCETRLVRDRVPTPEGVAYVRRRSWLRCPDCGRSLVADDPREAP
ncbi:MAG: hypothetical protein P8188_17045 [Gemmatimonadota bacterium]|jgi:uncharacterized protein with PIN domain